MPLIDWWDLLCAEWDELSVFLSFSLQQALFGSKKKTCIFEVNTIVDLLVLQDITLKENKELHQLLFAHCEQSIRQDHSQHYLLLFSPGA